MRITTIQKEARIKRLNKDIRKLEDRIERLLQDLEEDPLWMDWVWEHPQFRKTLVLPAEYQSEYDYYSSQLSKKKEKLERLTKLP